MKKILGIIASPRRLGNGEILVKEAAAAAVENAELELVRLAELNIRPCKACYSCLMPDHPCPLDDDLYSLLGKLKHADGLIFSAPCYALGPAGMTKLFGDRIIALAQHIEDLAHKPAVIITTAGIKGWEGYTLTSIVANMRFLGFEVKDAQMFLGALPGEALENPQALERVRLLGASLFARPRQPKNGECPTCWSDLWKFPEPNHAVCPLCGQEATIIAGADGISVHWEYGSASSRFTKAHLQEHFQVWLKDEVEEFKKRRRELAVIRNQYK